MPSSSSFERHRHDQDLSAWGPYTKRYIGLSHVADQTEGLRFDLSVVPAFFRRAVQIPNVMFESGYHPWQAAPDLSYFCHRHELEWKDDVYTDVSFTRQNEASCLFRAEMVNNTGTPQNLALHLFASLHFPAATHDKTFTPLAPARPELSEGALWIDAMDYASMSFARPKPTDFLTSEGLRRGEVRGQGFVRNCGLGDGFGREKGDEVRYHFSLNIPLKEGRLLVRYRHNGSEPVRLDARGMLNSEIPLQPGVGFLIASIPLGPIAAAEHELHLFTRGGQPVELDGFVVTEASRASAVAFCEPRRDPVPEAMESPVPGSLLLKYGETKQWYGIAWDFPNFVQREILHSELDVFLRVKVHDHVSARLVGDEKGHFANAFLAPVFLEPNSRHTISGLVCQGTKDEVTDALSAFAQGTIEVENLHLQARQKAELPASNPSGDPFRFSQEKMAATTLTNVVYPIYCRGGYIRHYTPGRWWDCLYSWDSGFIGLGLLDIDIERAIDCLKAYLTAPGDMHGAFIHRGSPVPVQLYLAQEIWNRTQDRELLAEIYPSLRQYHRFLAGHGPSTTRRLKSNLLTTWDYFYNSGGWDDYPPQKFVHKNKLTKTVAPIANTAHAIRTARILRLFAAEGLGAPDDVKEYDADISLLTDAILQHAYDDLSGYFGYVRHDEQGRPSGILRHESGANFNMGLDGAYPLFAGICSPGQEERLLSFFRSSRHLWSEAGLSTVDQSAPYFSPDGYWNGAVWMPHQWLFWKSFLDLGQGDLATRIARQALELWKNEVNESYNCFEHFLVKSRRGAGWHHFGGLSCPVLNWFSSYHRPGRLSVGYDAWISSLNFSDNNTRLAAELKLTGDREGCCHVLATLHPDFEYKASWNGREVDCAALHAGTCQIALPLDQPGGSLIVEKRLPGTTGS